MMGTSATLDELLMAAQVKIAYNGHWTFTLGDWSQEYYMPFHEAVGQFALTALKEFGERHRPAL